MFNPNESPFVAEPGSDGTLIFRDKIVDAATGELRAPGGHSLPALADATVRENFPPRRRQRAVLWGRVLNGQTLANPQGAGGSQTSVVSRLSLHSIRWLLASASSKPINAPRKVLEFDEIKTGEIIRTVDLATLDPWQAAGMELQQFRLPQPAAANHKGQGAFPTATVFMPAHSRRVTKKPHFPER